MKPTREEQLEAIKQRLRALFQRHAVVSERAANLKKRLDSYTEGK